MPLIRYVWYLTGQVVGLAIGGRRPVVLVLVVVGGLIAIVASLVQVVAPAAIYPFI